MNINNVEVPISKASRNERIPAIVTAIQKTPLDAKLRIDLVRLYIASGSAEEAMRQIYVLESMGCRVESLERLKTRALKLIERGRAQHRARLERLQEAVASHPTDADIRLRLLTILRKANLAEALRLGRHFMVDLPSSVKLRVIVTEMLLQACIYDEAETQVRKLIGIAPELQRSYILAGRVMIRTGRYQEAEEYYTRASELGALSDNDAMLLERARQNNLVLDSDIECKPSSAMQLHNDSITSVNIGYTTRFEEVRQYLSDRTGLDRKLRILSFGCSVGNEVGLLKEVFPDAQIFGCDVDEGSLHAAEAKQADSRTTIFRSTAENLEKYGPFDVITCMSVLCRYPASEYIDDMSAYLPFLQFQSMIDIIDGNLALGGVLVLWNAVYPFSKTRQASMYDVLPSRVVGLNGYTSIFHPGGRRLTRYMRNGVIRAQELLSPADIEISDLTCVLRRKIAGKSFTTNFDQLCDGRLLNHELWDASLPQDVRPDQDFNKVIDFSSSAERLIAKAEAMFGLLGKTYLVSGFGIEIYQHTFSTDKYKGYWLYSLEGTVDGLMPQRNALLRDMNATEVAAFLA